MAFSDMNNLIASIGTTSTVVLIEHERGAPIMGRASVPVATLTAVDDAVHHPDAGGRVGRMVREGGDSKNRLAVYFRTEILPVRQNPNGNHPWWVSIDGVLHEAKAVESWQAGGFWVAKVEEVPAENARVFFGAYAWEDAPTDAEIQAFATSTLTDLGAWGALDPEVADGLIADLVSSLEATFDSINAWLAVVATTEEAPDVPLLSPVNLAELEAQVLAWFFDLDRIDPFTVNAGFSPSRSFRAVFSPEGADLVVLAIPQTLSAPLVTITFRASIDDESVQVTPFGIGTAVNDGVTHNVYSFLASDVTDVDGLCRIEVL